MRTRVKRWENEVRTTRCKVALAIPDCDKFDVDLVELSFERVKDAAEREYLDRVPTAFTLSSEQIIRLRRAAHLLVEESPELRVFLEESAQGRQRAHEVGAAPTRAIGNSPMQRRRALRDPRAMQPIRRILVAVKNPTGARAARGQQGRADRQGPRARSSRCFTTSPRRCTPRRCRAAKSTCNRGSAKCRLRGASSSKNSPCASASTASTSTWSRTGTFRRTKPSSARRSGSRPTCWSSRIHPRHAAAIRRAGCWRTPTGNCCGCVRSRCCW